MSQISTETIVINAETKQIANVYNWERHLTIFQHNLIMLWVQHAGTAGTPLTVCLEVHTLLPILGPWQQVGAPLLSWIARAMDQRKSAYWYTWHIHFAQLPGYSISSDPSLTYFFWSHWTPILVQAILNLQTRRWACHRWASLSTHPTRIFATHPRSDHRPPIFSIRNITQYLHTLRFC